MEKISSSCIEKIYNIDTDSNKLIEERLCSFVQKAELAYMRSERDVMLLRNRKHKRLKRITDDLFKKIDEQKL
jgi:hypothetical protein